MYATLGMKYDYPYRSSRYNPARGERLFAPHKRVPHQQPSKCEKRNIHIHKLRKGRFLGNKFRVGYRGTAHTPIYCRPPFPPSTKPQGQPKLNEVSEHAIAM